MYVYFLFKIEKGLRLRHIKIRALFFIRFLWEIEFNFVLNTILATCNSSSVHICLNRQSNCVH